MRSCERELRHRHDVQLNVYPRLLPTEGYLMTRHRSRHAAALTLGYSFVRRVLSWGGRRRIAMGRPLQGAVKKMFVLKRGRGGFRSLGALLT